MQALAANRHFIEAFGLRPIIMMRSIPDMLASFWDMLEFDPTARAEGLNCQIPDNFVDQSRAQKADFMVDVIAPWYASYFATWKSFVDDAPETICVLHYNDFCADPTTALHAALAHAGFFVSRAKCRDVLRPCLDGTQCLSLQQRHARAREGIFFSFPFGKTSAPALLLSAIGVLVAGIDGQS